jgi:hypothetical protein
VHKVIERSVKLQPSDLDAFTLRCAKEPLTLRAAAFVQLVAAERERHATKVGTIGIPWMHSDFAAVALGVAQGALNTLRIASVRATRDHGDVGAGVERFGLVRKLAEVHGERG